MVSGALPAVLIFFIRLFVPESKKWEQQHARGATSHWANRDLIGVLIGCAASLAIIWVWMPGGPSIRVAGVVTLIGLAIALAGYLWPVWRYLSRAGRAGSMRSGSEREVLGRMLLGAALAGVALLGTWGAIQSGAPVGVRAATRPGSARQGVHTDLFGSWGDRSDDAGGVGSRAFRPPHHLCCALPWLDCLGPLALSNEHSLRAVLFILQFSGGRYDRGLLWLVPTLLARVVSNGSRATGQGFAYNFGRILAAIGGLQTATLVLFFDGNFPQAGSVLTAIYLVGVIVVWFGPETKGRPLPE